MFVAGEGRHELGRFHSKPPGESESGAIEGLLLRAAGKDGDADRGRAIVAALDECRAKSGPRVVGGCAIECLESWILALQGREGTERQPVKWAKTQLGPTLEADHTKAFFEIASSNSTPAQDAKSLLNWLQDARTALTPAESEG